MNAVDPIAITSVDWDTFLRTARTQLSRSVTETLDRAKLSANTPAAYITSLAEAQRAKTIDNASVLRDAGGLLRHASASFLFSAEQETLLYIVENCFLYCTRWSDKRTMTVSGTMLAWRTAIADYCHEDVPRDVRELFNKAMTCFEISGFGPLWSEYRKTISPDKTFLLTEK